MGNKRMGPIGWIIIIIGAGLIVTGVGIPMGALFIAIALKSGWKD